MPNTEIKSTRVGPWPGGWNWVDGELGVKPDELWKAENIILGPSGELRKRPGYNEQSTNHPAWNAKQWRHWQLRLSNGSYYDIVLDAAGTYWATYADTAQSFASNTTATTSSMTADSDAFWTGACIFKDVFYTTSWRTNGPKTFDGLSWYNITDSVLDGSSLREFPVAKHLLTKHERVFAANVELQEGTELMSDNERSIETDATGWAVGENCTLAQATPPVAAPDGTKSLEVTAVAAGTTYAKLATVEAVIPGGRYRFRAQGLAEAASRTARIRIDILDAESVRIDLVDLGSLTAMSTSAWTALDEEYTMPTNAAYVEIHLYTNTLLITEQFHWDQIQMNVAVQEKRSRLYFSEAGDPTTWKVLNWIDVEPDDGNQITGLASFGEYVVIFKETSVFLLSGVDEQTFTLFPLDTTVGTVSPYSISGSATHLYWYDHFSDHIYRFNGSSIEKIDDKIFGYVDSIIFKESLVAEAVAGIFYRDHYLLSFQQTQGSTVKANNSDTVVFNEVLQAWTSWPTMGFADATIDNTEPDTRGNLFILGPAAGGSGPVDQGLSEMVWSQDMLLQYTADHSGSWGVGDTIPVSVISGWYPVDDALVGQENVRVRQLTTLVRTTAVAEDNILNVYFDVNYDRSTTVADLFEMYSAGSEYGVLLDLPTDIYPLAHPGFVSSYSVSYINSTAIDTFEIWGLDVSSSRRRRGKKRGTVIVSTVIEVGLTPAIITLVPVDMTGTSDAVITPAVVVLVPVDVSVQSPAVIQPATIVLTPVTLLIDKGDAYSATYSATY
jgi:hypothetical protein